MSSLVTVSSMSVAKAASLASLSQLKLLFSWQASLGFSTGAEAPSTVGFVLGMFWEFNGLESKMVLKASLSS